MPRGGGRGGKSHKGGHRHFTSLQELQGQQEEIRRLKEAQENGIELPPTEEAASSRPDAKVTFKKNSDESSDSSDESESDDDGKPTKGVQHLIQVANPNRQKKAHMKVDDLDVAEAKPTLSRKEREVVEEEQRKAAYQRLHEQGLTDEAHRDLARLALIRQQREETAKKREAEKAAKAAESAPAKPTGDKPAASTKASGRGRKKK